LNPGILEPKIQKFIDANSTADVSKLALGKNPFPEIEYREILNQISGKSKAKEKLPSWFGTEGIYYPEKISLEQASSESTAIYKSAVVSGVNLIDLTGGFGIDDYFFSKKVGTVTHCEQNNGLSEIAKHNFLALKAQNIECITGDGVEIIKSKNKKWDWIYIDPSRRSDSKGKVFMLKDCIPNVPEHLTSWFSFSNNILIKTSPLLDLSAGLSELQNVKRIHIIAVKNEVKELLWELEKGYSGEISVKAVDISNDKQKVFDSIINEEVQASFSLPMKYLYEPNAAIMKSGAFNKVSILYNINKLHLNSHLYTSDDIMDFPGRIFEIENHLSYNKSTMKLIAEMGRANITTRNFPESVESLRKKWKIQDGGTKYCFFTTDIFNNKIVLICTKIKQL